MAKSPFTDVHATREGSVQRANQVLAYLADEIGVGEPFQPELNENKRYAAGKVLYDLTGGEDTWPFGYSNFNDWQNRLEEHGRIKRVMNHARDVKSIEVVDDTPLTMEEMYGSNGQKPKSKQKKDEGYAKTAKPSKAKKDGSPKEKAEAVAKERGTVEGRTRTDQILNVLIDDDGRIDEEDVGDVLHYIARRVGASRNSVTPPLSKLDKDGLIHKGYGEGNRLTVITAAMRVEDLAKHLSHEPSEGVQELAEEMGVPIATSDAPTPDVGDVGSSVEAMLTKRLDGLMDWVAEFTADLIEASLQTAHAKVDAQMVDPKEIKKRDEQINRLKRDLEQANQASETFKERAVELDEELADVRKDLANARRSLESFRKEFEGSGLGSRIASRLSQDALADLDKLMRQLPEGR